MKLTQAKIGLMARAYELRTYHGADGVYPLSGGQSAALRQLEGMGLMRFCGYGTDIDEGVGLKRPIWEITPAGEKALVDAGEIDARRGGTAK